MAYRNKTYVAFDADTDMNYYKTMKMWNANNNLIFNFHNAHEINSLRGWSSEETIKRKLRERLANTKIVVVLIGKNTKNLYKYVRWEIDYAIEKNIPIIGVNLNGGKKQDYLCPPIMKNELAIYVPFGLKIIDFALNNWASSHFKYRNNNNTGAYYYPEKVYKKL